MVMTSIMIPRRTTYKTIPIDKNIMKSQKSPKGQHSPCIEPDSTGHCTCSSLSQGPFCGQLNCFEGMDLLKLAEPPYQQTDVSNKERSIKLHNLALRCIKSFDSNGEVREGEALPRHFFLVSQWFIQGVTLIYLFEQIYDACREQCPSCAHNGCYVKLEGLQQAAASINNKLIHLPNHSFQDTNPFLHAPQCICTEAISRVCGCIRFWIVNYPMHFDDNPSLCQSIMSLQRKMLADELNEFAAYLDLSKVPSYAWLRNLSVRHPMVRQFSLCFDEWTPNEIATNLTHIEYRTLRRIQFAEYRQYACTSNLKETPVLQRSIAAFNSLSGWVQCMVLSKVTPKERAEFIVKFVNVAKKLRDLNNFNTLMAIVGGLTHSAIARLMKTRNCLPSDTTKELSDLENLLASSANFMNYRKAMEKSRGAKIPIIGVHLKDLISVHVAMSDWIDGGVNTRKWLQLVAVFVRLLDDLQKEPILPEPNVDLINTLKVSLDIRYNDDEIYELSLKREPRTLLNVYSSCQKSLVFADWAAGVSSEPDPGTVHKHVAAMVDAVFKHYDQDRDNYISQGEFQSIAGNFPVIDPFPVIDADRDGKISKSEMTDYFVRMSHNSEQFRRGFKHNFYETTFLAPTTCVHCARLLWGMIRQGYKCKDCGIAVHRACKDSAVAECRRRTSGLGNMTNRSFSLTYSEESHSSQQTPVSSEASTKRRMFLNLGRPKMRNPSSASPAETESPSPDPTPPPVLFNTRPPRCTLFRGSRKLRTRSETTDLYRSHSPEMDVLPSLASEEVFEDESSAEHIHISSKND